MINRLRNDFPTVWFLLLYYFVIGWISPTHNDSSNHLIAKQQKVYSRKIVHKYFLRLLINKINYVDRFGMVSVRNAHYLSDIHPKKLNFSFLPFLTINILLHIKSKQKVIKILFFFWYLGHLDIHDVKYEEAI